MQDFLFGFDHPHQGSHAELAGRLGGKGASLWAMTHRLGLAVPPGFTLCTEACLRCIDHGLSAADRSAIRRAVGDIEARLDRGFGDPSRPLLLSVRSGAAASMPGMMDTVLNVGLTPATEAGLARDSGDPGFALDSHLRFLRSFGTTVKGIETAEPPGSAAERREFWIDQIDRQAGAGALDDPWALLFATIEAVFRSWHSPRAVHYRQREGLAEGLGTAVTVQAMVFGNLDEASGTGVLFTRDPMTGAPLPRADFLFKAQGDDVVGGGHQTEGLDALARRLPAVHEELLAAGRIIEAYYRDMSDIEFTVERGRLWILQARAGKRSPAAAARIAVDLVGGGPAGLTRQEALARVPAEVLNGGYRLQLASGTEPVLARGLGASPGVATGKVVFDPDTALEWTERGETVILVRRETSPQDVHGMGVAAGILTTLGGLMSHAAVVARAWAIPAVVGADTIGIGDECMSVGDTVCRQGDVISIDGQTGCVYRGGVASRSQEDPCVEILRQWQREAAEGAKP